MTTQVFQYWVNDDGGKLASGRKGTSGDCVVRAIAIASGMPYETVYRMVAKEAANFGFKKSARDGIHNHVRDKVLKDLGYIWHAAPKIAGRKARCSDLYDKGMVIARQARHIVAVNYGMPHDIFNSSTKMVYGYWSKNA
jgi:hypothetical protein